MKGGGVPGTVRGLLLLFLLYNLGEYAAAQELSSTSTTTTTTMSPSTTPEPPCCCLMCICEALGGAAGCEQNRGCETVNGVKDCGPFHITKDYYKECKKGNKAIKEKGWKGCTKEMECSKECVKSYMEQHGTTEQCGCLITCEKWAMLQVDGPSGCSNSSEEAEEAAEKVKDCCKKKKDGKECDCADDMPVKTKKEPCDEISSCCMMCICEEAGCEDKPFNIGKTFFKDCKGCTKCRYSLADKDWETCRSDMTCAKKCVMNYMELWAKKKCDACTCKNYARLFHGPGQCKTPSDKTEKFANKVMECCGKKSKANDCDCDKPKC